MTLAVLLMTTFGGCGVLQTERPVGASLPAAPADLVAPVPRPPMERDDNARLTAARALACLKQANDKLADFAEWYEAVRKTYAAPTSRGD